MTQRRHKRARRHLARQRTQSKEQRYRAELSAFCDDLGRLAWAVCMMTRTVRLNVLTKEGK